MADCGRASRATELQSYRAAFLVVIDLFTEDEDKIILAKRNQINWVRPQLARRDERGAFYQLVRELALEDATYACQIGSKCPNVNTHVQISICMSESQNKC